jgi:FxLD family lantipeptide
MTIRLDQTRAASDMLATEAEFDEFDLDVRIVESGPVIDELLRLTDDNCGTTCESACTSC